MMEPADNSFGVLRLAMASAVVVSHSYWLATGIGGVTEPVHAWTGYTLGQHAVQVFFFLSGILVAQSLVRGGVVRFLLARGLRIFPGLAVCVLLTALLLGPLVSSLPAGDYFSSTLLPRYLAETLSLKTGLAPLPGVFTENPVSGIVNSSLWTLKYEVVCYLALAVFGGLALRIGRVRLVGYGLLAAFLASILFARPELAEQSGQLDKVRYFALFFGTGVLAFALRQYIRVHWSLALTAVALLWLTNGMHLAEVGQAIGLGYLSIYAASFTFGPLRAFANRDDLSYGVYIYGVPVGQTICLLAPGIGPVALMAATLAACLVLALLSWRLIERPAMALRRLYRNATPARQRKLAVRIARVTGSHDQAPRRDNKVIAPATIAPPATPTETTSIADLGFVPRRYARIVRTPAVRCLA
ncbi:MAG: acyltransferase family protein [Hyphomicrobiaceae bacterium]